MSDDPKPPASEPSDRPNVDDVGRPLIHSDDPPEVETRDGQR